MIAAYYDDTFTRMLRDGIFVIVALILAAFIWVVIEMAWERWHKSEKGPYDWAEEERTCPSREVHVRVVQRATLTDQVLKAIKDAEERSLAVAKCLYRQHMQAFWPGYTPFDELPIESRLVYFDEAEQILMLLNDLEMDAKSPAPPTEAKGAGLA